GLERRDPEDRGARTQQRHLERSACLDPDRDARAMLRMCERHDDPAKRNLDGGLGRPDHDAFTFDDWRGLDPRGLWPPISRAIHVPHPAAEVQRDDVSPTLRIEQRPRDHTMESVVVVMERRIDDLVRPGLDGRQVPERNPALVVARARTLDADG